MRAVHPKLADIDFAELERKKDGFYEFRTELSKIDFEKEIIGIDEKIDTLKVFGSNMTRKDIGNKYVAMLITHLQSVEREFERKELNSRIDNLVLSSKELNKYNSKRDADLEVERRALDARIDKLVLSSKELNKYNDRRDTDLENEVYFGIKSYLKNEKFEILGEYPNLQNWGLAPNGKLLNKVEWDGALLVLSERKYFLYLIETTQTNTVDEVIKTAQRLEITKAIILNVTEADCSDLQPYKYAAQSLLLNKWKEMQLTVIGVMSSPNLQENVVNYIKKMKLSYAVKIHDYKVLS